MNYILLFKLTIIYCGTIIGLFLSDANKIFWSMEIAIILNISLLLLLKNETANTQNMLKNLKRRIFLLLIFTLYSSFIFSCFIDYWKEMIGCLSGILVALWLDYVQFFYDSCIEISFIAKFLIFLKIVGILLMNEILLFNTKNGNLLLIATLISSLLFGITLMELLYINIKSIMGIYIERNIELFNIFRLIDLFFSFLLSILFIFNPLETELNIIWLFGLVLNLITNNFGYLLFRLELNNLQIYPEGIRLNEVTIVINPNDDIKLGEKL